jgi:YVTN family beta-propeller protein
MSSATETYPVVLWMDGCGHTSEVCGDIEYADPKHPEFTLCAPQLVFMGRDGDRDVFDESPAYGADRCRPATLEIARVGSSKPLTLDVEAYTDSGAPPCCHGTLTQTSDQPPGVEPPPILPVIEGLTGPLSWADLGGPTTQYSAADANNAYFPIPGALARVALDTGQSDEMATNGDVASTADPNAVATVGDAIWITRGPTKTLERVDVTPEGAATPSIQLPDTPYALAADGATLWVTSLEDGVVMAVDTETGNVVATVDVPYPAGVAVGDGAVWVVEHADGKLARIDPTTARVTDEVVLGKGDDPDCGMCAGQVIYAFGSAWTANDLGRSITRVDGRSLKATTFPTYNRVWSVAAYGRYIYGSEVENFDGYIDRSIGGLVRIDPRTGKVDQFPAPGVLGVAALGGYLWLIVPARRSDFVLSYKAVAR